MKVKVFYIGSREDIEDSVFKDASTKLVEEFSNVKQVGDMDDRIYLIGSGDRSNMISGTKGNVSYDFTSFEKNLYRLEITADDHESKVSYKFKRGYDYDGVGLGIKDILGYKELEGDK